MEAKETMDTGNAQKIKDRLNELRELCQTGYITELEFKIARVNALKDHGIDIATQRAHRPYFQEEEEESRGCGCFLATLLLAMFFVLGVAFFVAPYWPERFGGAGARAAREWFTTRGTEFIDGFLNESDD